MLTGQLGDVMKESARAAWSYARAHAAALGIAEETFERDVHIHVPAGAIPKDGPSAGVTMATALVSALSGRTARFDLAMTGEITLTGRVLPIGGLKEKVLGAVRAGITEIILPKENEADLRGPPRGGPRQGHRLPGLRARRGARHRAARRLVPRRETAVQRGAARGRGEQAGLPALSRDSAVRSVASRRSELRNPG